MKASLILFTTIIFLSLSHSVFSEDISGRWAVGYRYGYVDADDADYKHNVSVHGLNLTYGLNNNFALELEADYFRLDSKDGTELGVYSLYSNLQLRADFFDIIPYLVGGVGAQYYDYGIIKRDDRKDKDYSFSYKLGAGMEYFLNKNWALHLESAYTYGNTGGSATLDVYSWRYGGGIKYYF